MPGRSYEINPSEIDQPPQPPDISRRLRTSATRLVVLFFLGGVVAAACLGLFGPNRGSVQTQNTGLEMHVEYPDFLRYKRIDRLDVALRNTSDERIDTLTVRFETSYIDRFSNVSFIPSADEVWEVELTGIPPGRQRRIRGHLQAERYGRHRGTITAFFQGSDTVRAAIGTLVYP